MGIQAVLDAVATIHQLITNVAICLFTVEGILSWSIYNGILSRGLCAKGLPICPRF